MEVHVIRHTPVDFDKNKCYGRLDVPLANSFEEDVAKISLFLEEEYDKVYCSPKSRCTQLAHALQIADMELNDQLLELDFGEWEGKLWNEIHTPDLNAWMEDFVHVSRKGGESLQEMFSRVSTFMDSLRNENADKVLLITHAGVIRCLWSYVLAVPLENIFKIPVGFHEHFVFRLGTHSQLDTLVKLK